MSTENRNHPDDQSLIESLHQLHSERICDQLVTFQDQAYAMGVERGET